MWVPLILAHLREYSNARFSAKVIISFMHIFVYSDGGSRGNPGPAGSGFILKDARGKILRKQAIFLGERTNNQAEYYALLKALESLPEGTREVTCRLDSQLVVRQLQGVYKIKDPVLRDIAAKITQRAQAYHVTYEHIPRELNAEADAMANEAMDRGVRVGDTFSYLPS